MLKVINHQEAGGFANRSIDTTDRNRDPTVEAVDTKITIYGISVSDRILKQHSHGEACKAGTGVPRSQEIAPPPRTVTRAYAQAYCRVLGGGVFLRARYPCIPAVSSA